MVDGNKLCLYLAIVAPLNLELVQPKVTRVLTGDQGVGYGPASKPYIWNRILTIRIFNFLLLKKKLKHYTYDTDMVFVCRVISGIVLKKSRKI